MVNAVKRVKGDKRRVWVDVVETPAITAVTLVFIFFDNDDDNDNDDDSTLATSGFLSIVSITVFMTSSIAIELIVLHSIKSLHQEFDSLMIPVRNHVPLFYNYHIPHSFNCVPSSVRTGIGLCVPRDGSTGPSLFQYSCFQDCEHTRRGRSMSESNI